jgi:hypothetical protein
MEIEAVQYRNNMWSLTDPVGYANDRMVKYDEVMLAVDACFKTTYESLTAAGMAPDEAKDYAKGAAAREKDIKMAVFNMNYPDTANAVAHTKLNQLNASNFGGMAPGSTKAPVGAGSTAVKPKRKYVRKTPAAK